MMKKLLVLTLVLALTSGASAALTLAGGPDAPIAIGETATVTVQSTEDGAYSGWLEVKDPAILSFGDVEFTAAGDPGTNSTAAAPAEFDGSMWVEFTVASFSPTNPILAGDHILAGVVGAGEGTTQLNLYASDGVTLWDSADITVIPEPVTVLLLGLGSLFLRRRT
jgi:hypothetical protein